jgi:hypothetical protein
MLRSMLFRRLLVVSGIGVALVSQGGCEPTTAAVVGGVVGVTVVGGYSPANEIEQVYYLGVFDPQDQVPPSIYRLTVRGQASAISGMKFGSGWVQASLIDSLNTQIQLPMDGATVKINGASKDLSAIKTGRRLMMFGPEGFREAPRDQRLVIVMGSSPEKYFSAIDEALGSVAQAQAELYTGPGREKLLETLLATKNEQDRLTAQSTAIKAKLAADNGEVVQ